MKSLLPGILVLVVVILANQQAIAAPGEVISPPPPVICASRGDRVTLVCYIFREGYWSVNGTLLNPNYADPAWELDPGYIYTGNVFTHQNMSLTLPAMYDTTFTCISTGTATNQPDTSDTELIVSHTRPDPPTNLTTYITSSSIQLSWVPPDKAKCIGYTVGITNRSDGSAHHYKLINSEHESTFEIPNPSGGTEDHELDFYIWATNEFGDSDVSTLLAQEIPNDCITATDTVEPPHTAINTESSTETPTVTTASSEVTASNAAPSIANTAAAKLPESTTNDSTENRIAPVPNNNPSRSDDAIGVSGAHATADAMQLSLVGGILGVVIVVCALALVIVTAVYICHRRKRGDKNENITKGDVENLKIKEKPKSLRPMVTNPIYDGPTYDSPVGDHHRPLISRQISTPDSPRYFDAPPALPPPRKASVSMPSNAAIASMKKTVDAEMIRAGNGPSAPAGNEEYTTMQPVAPHQTRQALQSVKEAYTTRHPQEDEYITIKT